MGDVGQRHEAQRRIRGRAIDDDEFIAAGFRVLLHGEQGRDLFGAGKQRQLFGHHGVDAVVLEHRHQVLADSPPVAEHLHPGVDLDGVEARRDLRRLGAQTALEHVAQAVGGVGGGDQRATTARGGAGGRGGRRGRLPDAALSGVENEPHRPTVSRRGDDLPDCVHGAAHPHRPGHRRLVPTAASETSSGARSGDTRPGTPARGRPPRRCAPR